MIVLQKFGFKESRYERPQDKWLCGHLADGTPCTRGPDRNGHCKVTTACTPRQVAGKDDKGKEIKGRWECRRSMQEGGPCEAGPFPDGRCCQMLTPCEPLPSLRTKRKRAGLWATALAVGVAALVLAGGTANRYLMPGPLTSQHAGLTECSSCHAGAGPGKMDWVHQVVTTVNPKQNADLCLGCHAMGSQPFAPHTHPIDELKRLTEASRETSKGTSNLLQRIALSRPMSLPSDGAAIYCATCHKEHRGEFRNLQEVSNERCQTCHVSKFGSFATSHPQFSDYPYRRRTRIVFDHAAHMEKYFPETAKEAAAGQAPPPACNGCHQPGFDQKYMEVKSYGAMCSNCHNKDVLGTGRTTGPKGIDFLSVPGLDLNSLTEKKVDIGDWPKSSEAALTPFMRLLLAASGETAAMELGDIDLIDLSQAAEEDLAKVKALAWSIKRIFAKLEATTLETVISGGQAGSGADRQQLAVLTGAISHDVILAANREWFPNLQDDLQKNEKGEPTAAFGDPDKQQEAKASAPFDAEAWAEFGGWYRQDYTVRYRPSGHADPFLRAWLNYSGQSFAAGPQNPVAPVFELLASQDAVGRCIRCHSIDAAETGPKQINWRPFYTDHTKNRFTSFAHKAHISAVGTKGCAACHELNAAGGDYVKSYQGGDANVHVPNFKHIDKSLCASCHTRQASWESCTLCHDYHVTESKDSSRLGKKPQASAAAK